MQVNIPKVQGRNAALNIDLSVTSIPVNRITAPELLKDWISSEAYLRVLDFIISLNSACKNTKNSDECMVSSNVNAALKMLDFINKWVDEIPPNSESQRFGNTAFRDWIARLRTSDELHSFIPENLRHFIPELQVYLFGGFGDQTRIDYGFCQNLITGSGHEFSFVAWLTCLDLIGIFILEDYKAIVTKIFARYLDVVRRIQLVYKLEPAGSHGVWGLDDHQFLPYFWGASQLLDHVFTD